MERYIHRENLTLLRKRLTEAQDETTRKVILKLLAEEEAKAPTLHK
jgi:bacterioferritin (cytochrome b1)